MSKSVKLTKNEVAYCIRRDGVKDHFRSSALCEYWSAFGQRWRIYVSSRYDSNNVTKIEQIDEDDNLVCFKETPLKGGAE